MENSYNDNVFINCPFDDEYRPIFDAIVFTIYACGFIARCAKEYSDSNDIRIEKIFRLIEQSKFGIHDLSRIELSGGKLPRFNMPLELGMFMGSKKFGSENQRDKKFIVLDSEAYRYQKFISDISGQDIHIHNNNVNEAIKIVRNWLSRSSRRIIPGGTVVADRYKAFKADLPALCSENKWECNELTFPEYSSLTSFWLGNYEKRKN